MIHKGKSVLPMGAATLAFLVVALVIQNWPKSNCEQLENKMNKGYFLRWLPPKLVLLTADKQKISVTAKSKQLACEKILLKTP